MSKIKTIKQVVALKDKMDNALGAYEVSDPTTNQIDVRVRYCPYEDLVYIEQGDAETKYSVAEARGLAKILTQLTK